MRKYFAIIIFTHLAFISALAQTEKIDSLKKVLPSLHDKEKINCLNELSKHYCNYDGAIRHYARTDSAELSAKEAYSESVALKYKLGIGEAFLNLGGIHLQRCNFDIAQKYLEKAIFLFNSINAEPELIKVYSILVDVFLSECDNTSARKYAEILLDYYKKKKDIIGQEDALDDLSSLYMWQGKYEKAFDCIQNKFDLLKNQTDSRSVIAVLGLREGLYRSIQWDDSAASCAAKIVMYEKKMRVTSGGGDTINEIGQTSLRCFLERKFDSCEYYNQIMYHFLKSNKGYDSIVKERLLSRTDADIASIYQYEGRYKEALPMFVKVLKYDREKNNPEAVDELTNISQIYDLEGKYNDAIRYAQDLVSLSLKTESSYYLQGAYKELWKIYNNKKDSANAYKYFIKYTDLKDSTITRQFQRKLMIINELTNEKEQQLKIAALDKDNKLKQDAIQKSVLIRNILLSGLGILILLGGIIYRFINLKQKNEKFEKITLQHSLDIERIQNEKKQSELQNEAAELEMYALRAQMNPHFIFNSLSAINLFILENNKLQASEYLSKFSRLIRLILQNSQKAFIPLDKELEALQLYLELESLRFENKFEYKIIKGDELDTEMLKVPPLIIQPYVENAIWHGLMHKRGTGHLEIELYSEGQILFCKILTMVLEEEKQQN